MNNLSTIEQEIKPILKVWKKIEPLPCRCKFSSDEFPYGCEDTGILINTIGQGYRCAGFLAELRDSELKRFISELPAKFKAIEKPDNRDYQNAVFQKIDKAKGLYLYGVSEFGKTFLIYRLIYLRIKNTVGPVPTWLVVKSLDLIDSFLIKHNSEIDKDS